MGLWTAAAEAQTGRRVALVIGNAEYRQAPALRGADESAQEVGAALERLGFSVARAVNADLAAMRASVAAFQRSAASADAAFVYYAGHAFRFGGASYLVPVDAGLKDDASYEWDTIQLDQLVGALAAARAAVLVVEGCGQDGLDPVIRRSAGAAHGVGEIAHRPELLVAASNARAADACAGGRGLLTEGLLAEIEYSHLPAPRLFRRLQQVVALRSEGRQTVDVGSGLTRDLVFARAESAPAAFRRLGLDPASADMRVYVDRYGEHPLGLIVKAMIASKDQGPARRDPWRGLIDEKWTRDREDKARAAREDALEARWSREQADRQAERQAAELRRQELERQAREQVEREQRARIAREQEEERRRQAEAAAAEQKRAAEVAAEQRRQAEAAAAELRRMQEDEIRREQAERARVAREQEERRRQAEATASEQRRLEQERIAREMAERARIAREQEEERKRVADAAAAEQKRLADIAAEQKRQADLAAAEQRRAEQERLAREQADRARIAREQEDERKRQADATAVEQRRLADIAAAEQRRQDQERIAREQAERVRIAREQEEDRKRQAEAAAAEQKRLADLSGEQKRQADLAAAEQRRAEQERLAREQADRSRIAREQEEQRRRAAEAAVADQRRAEQVRIAREQSERDDRARIAREQEEQRRRAAELAAADQRRAEQDRIAREQAERDDRARIAREQEEQRRRAAETALAEQKRAEEDRQRAAAASGASGGAPAPTGPATSPAGTAIAGLAVEEANRFTAEQRRLAQERIDRDRRARGEPAEFAAPLPSEQAQTGKPGQDPTQLAALAPPADRPAAAVIPTKPEDVMRAAQEELKRLGCFGGQPSGKLDAATRAALDAAGKRMSPVSILTPVTPDVLRALRGRDATLCALAARPSQKDDDEVARPARPRQQKAVAPVARPRPTVARRPPAARSGGGGCFSFNGRQYCQ